MSETTSHNNKNTQNSAAAPVLRKASKEAIQDMIGITRRLIHLVEAEANTIALNDMIGLTVIEQDKIEAITMYEAAAAEFQKRLDEFQGVDRRGVEELKALQVTLGDLTRANQLMLEKIRGHIRVSKG